MPNLALVGSLFANSSYSTVGQFDRSIFASKRRFGFGILTNLSVETLCRVCGIPFAVQELASIIFGTRSAHLL